MSSWPTLFAIARTHLLSRMKQTAVASLGVTFGIATFVILVSFMTGLNGLLDGLILNRTPHIRIYNEIKPSPQQPIDLSREHRDGMNVVLSKRPKKSQVRIRNAMPLMNLLRSRADVYGVCPQVGAQVFYLAGSIQLNGMVTGIDVEEEVRLFNFDNYITEGVPSGLTKINNGILLGAGLAKKMSLSVGDRIQVSSISGGIFPLKIVGIYQSGLAEVDNIQSYVSLSTARRILQEGPNYVSDLHVKLHDIDGAPTMARYLERQYDVDAIDIQTANAQFETGTSIRNLITYAVSITLLLVAGFGIYNILNMLIYEKMNDIAILKATGFSGRDVQYIFLLQALTIGVIGAVLGISIGYGVSVLISHTPFETEALPTVKTFPVNFNSMYYVIAVLFALLSTFFAGYLPARKARKIDPVEIIRGQ